MDNSKVIEKLFLKATKSKAVHEAVILVESKQSDFSINFGYGGRNADSPFFTASIGKMFTTSCILILEKQGKLSLDDSLNKYLDASILDGLHVFAGTDYSNRLTISNLLFQTSGIPDWLENGRDKKVFIDNDMFMSFEDKISSIKNDKRYFAPGTRSRYSDTNFCILAKIIEMLTEKPLANVCTDWIFNPLGLSKTYLPVDETDFVTNIFYNEKELSRPNAMRAASGSGDAMTTANEMMMFLKGFFGGNFFDKKIFTRLSNYGKLQIAMGGAWYGGGYMRIPLGVPRTLFFGGGELLGHTGATGSFAFYYPKREMFFVGDFNQAANPGLPMMTAVNLALRLK